VSVDGFDGGLREVVAALAELRELVERFDVSWLAAWSRVQLATLAVIGGQLEEARVRRALGADRFEALFAAGARLTLREAVAAIRDRRGASTTALSRGRCPGCQNAQPCP